MSFVGPSAVLEDMRLSNDAVRRILISLIMAEQESLHKKGVIIGDHLLGPKAFGRKGLSESQPSGSDTRLLDSCQTANGHS